MGQISELIVGLDIGTTKIAAVVGTMSENGFIVTGVGSHPSKGINKGMVVKNEEALASISKAVEEAELTSNCEIRSVVIGIDGTHIKGFNSHGATRTKYGEVTERDIERVLNAAGTVDMPPDCQILHLLPWDYVLDGQNRLADPMNMLGNRLEAHCHIIMALSLAVANLARCCHLANLRVENITFAPLAAARTVLTSDEKENGVVLIDMGGSTTDILVYEFGNVVCSAMVPFGGINITQDLAHCLQIAAFPTAEQFKRRHGSAVATEDMEGEKVEVEVSKGETIDINRRIACKIIENRTEEIFQLAFEELADSGFKRQGATGVVITGGCAMLPRIDELAERIFGLPARIGKPLGIHGPVEVADSPSMTAAIGLAVLGAEENQFKPEREAPSLEQVWRKMRDWFRDFF